MNPDCLLLTLEHGSLLTLAGAAALVGAVCLVLSVVFKFLRPNVSDSDHHPHSTTSRPTHLPLPHDSWIPLTFRRR